MQLRPLNWLKKRIFLWLPLQKKSKRRAVSLSFTKVATVN